MSGRDQPSPGGGGEYAGSGQGIRLVARNGLLAATQVVLTSLGYLLAYRVMSSVVGIDVIGSWSLCLALGAIATLADLGASDGMARAVAQHAVNPDPPALRRVLVTGVLFCAAGCLVGGLLCYALVRALLPQVLSEPQALATTLSVLAPALLVAGLNSIGLSCQAALEGLERYFSRFIAATSGTVVFVAAIMVLVPAGGLQGMVWAYLAQAVVLLVISGAYCWRLTRPAVAVPGYHGPSRVVLGELLRVGLPVRATGLTTVLLDPLTRVAVTFFGGTASAGHYEVASRLVMQLRTVIVAGFQAGLPRLVKLTALGDDGATRLTGQTYRAGVSIAVAAFTTAALMGPFVYEFVLGHVPSLGMRFFVMLCAGWCVNAVSAPFFFSLLAKRRVAALWLSSGVMAVVNVALIGVLGHAFGDEGVVASLALAIAAGSVVTIMAARRSEKGLPRWIQGPELVLLVVSVATVVVLIGPSLQSGAATAAFIPLVFGTIAYGAIALTTMRYSGIHLR